jgi:tRNA-dihydrouridine synthase
MAVPGFFFAPGAAIIFTMTLYHPLHIGSLTLPGNLFLAPVAGYSDRAFRAICVEAGADFTCTELASAEALVRGGAERRGAGFSKTGVLLRRGEGESRYGIQLFGGNPEVMYRAALLLAPFRPDTVDINCGCPVPKVVKAGAGAALMRDTANLGSGWRRWSGLPGRPWEMCR